MRRFVILLVAAIWPSCVRAEFFRGMDDLKRHDIPAAIQELTPAAEAGEADAQDALGFAYDQIGNAANPARARELFRKAAENGLVLGMVNLAHALQDTRGGPANPAEAAEWLMRAAQAGMATAMVSLADAYRNGLGLPRDPANAQTWYERAAKLNNPGGMAGVADMMRQSTDPAIRKTGQDWLQRASAQGNPHAQQELAVAKLNGADGIPKDQPGGLALARSAALQGNGEAAVVLAECYHRGEGVPASDTEAVRWYAEAARLGAVQGQIETARAKLASGPAHDPAGAYLWIQVAARHPGQFQAVIASLDAAAARELAAPQQAELRARAATWRQGVAP